MTNNIKSNLTSEAWLRRMVALEDETMSISVGGLAADLGLLTPSGETIAGVFGRFVEFARRKERLSLEQLAAKISVDPPELLQLEKDPKVQVQPQTVRNLAAYLGLPAEPLLELAGLAPAKQPTIPTAAARFAVRSESTAELSSQEREAFDELVKVLAESSR